MGPVSQQEIESMCAIAGLKVLRIWRLPNQYFTYSDGEDEETTIRNAVYREKRPSWLVKTQYGLIQFNLRKRVLEINWSDTGITAKPGPADDVTKGRHHIHAWTLLKATEYLTEIANAVPTMQPDGGVAGSGPVSLYVQGFGIIRSGSEVPGA